MKAKRFSPLAVLGLILLMLLSIPFLPVHGRAQEGTPAAEASPEANETPGSVFATGTWRIAIVGAIHRSGIAGADLESRSGKDWVLVVADVTNWSEDEGTLDVKKFGVRPSGERKPTGISQKWTGVAAEKLQTEPKDVAAGIEIEPDDTVRMTLVFQVSEDLETLVLTVGKTAVSLSSVLENRFSLRNLPPVTQPPALEEVEVDEVLDDGVLSAFGEDDVERRVTLIGVDMPIGDECFADEAIDQLAELTSDVVWLEAEPSVADGDTLTRYAWIEEDGVMVQINQNMIAGGYAGFATNQGVPRFGDWLLESEVTAKAAGTGLWEICTGSHGTLAPTPTPEPVGTRENPISFGEEVNIGDWTFVVTDVVSDATELVLAESQINEPPAEGRQYTLITMAVTYNGKGSASLSSSVQVQAVGESNVAYDYRDGCSYVIPNPLPSTEVFEGGTLTGNICWSVRAEDVDSLVMFVDIGFNADNRVYLALQKE